MRVHYVNKARKTTTTTCLGCKKPIEAGQPYRYLQMWGFRKVRHSACGDFLGSEMTTSAPTAIARRAAEWLEDYANSLREAEFGSLCLHDVQMQLDDPAEMAQDAYSAFSESCSSIEDGFGQSTPMSEEMQDHADECYDWAEEIRDALDSVDDWEDFWEHRNADGLADPNEAWSDWIEEVADAIGEAASNCPV
jgi:hypothetical protein